MLAFLLHLKARDHNLLQKGREKKREETSSRKNERKFHEWLFLEIQTHIALLFVVFKVWARDYFFSGLGTQTLVVAIRHPPSHLQPRHTCALHLSLRGTEESADKDKGQDTGFGKPSAHLQG